MKIKRRTEKQFNKPNQLISLTFSKIITSTQRKAYNWFLKTAQDIIKFKEVEKYANIDENRSYRFEVNCKQLHNKVGIQNKNNNFLEKEFKKLMGIIVEVNKDDNKKDWLAFSLLPRIERKNGNYFYNLDGFLIKALKEQNFFTPLNLVTMNSLVSQYSVFFYELAIRYKKYKIPKMSVEKVRKLTNTMNIYKDFPDFRKRVLDPACKEISEKTDIILSYTTEKIGRRIAFIDFQTERKEIILTSDKNFEIEKEPEKLKEYSKKVLELFKLLPLEEQLEDRKNELEKILKNHSYEMILGDINYCKNNSKDNFWGYFLKSLKSGHYGKVKIEKDKIREEEKQKKIEEEKLKEEKKEEEKNKLLEAKEINNILDEKYNLYDEKTKELIRNTADEIIEKEGKEFKLDIIQKSMFNTIYKYKAMEILMEYKLIK